MKVTIKTNINLPANLQSERTFEATEQEARELREAALENGKVVANGAVETMNRRITFNS